MNRCKTCKFRNSTGYCINPKLEENLSQSDKDADDMLIYDYTEGGGFLVGPNFGCVHHAVKETK